METRKVSEHICLSELPFVMRAIGFYPSEEKVGGTKTRAATGCAIYKKQPLGTIIIGQSKKCTFFLQKWIRKTVLGISDALLSNCLMVDMLFLKGALLMEV